MTENPFTQRMAAKSNEELLVVVYNKDDYRLEAWEAAVQELSKRDISVEKQETAKIQLAQDNEIKKKKADEPLEIPLKILTFLIPAVITLIFSREFERKGYTKKAGELIKWTVLGFCFYGFLGLLLIWLDR